MDYGTGRTKGLLGMLLLGKLAPSIGHVPLVLVPVHDDVYRAVHSHDLGEGCLELNIALLRSQADGRKPG